MAVSVACMAICCPIPGFKGRTFKLCVLNRWDFISAFAAPNCGGNFQESILTAHFT